ncbi:Oligoxyloglucan reducing end-specific cellobiohydrolase [Rhizodiscina lignyota]|uniref:Vacuolar protein sorting/targeting protein 10 n=1 Tax=Rhizodiscina lignyota TaxID=1504668 RepID=A0A9P4IES5_9PEZI|nr:Oligoxyloglucan reducing end-specific cellobiohydrolase [Rhizodiscina lignyota]
MRLPYLAFLLALWPSAAVLAKGGEPKITPQKFDQAPQMMFFFDDSEVALSLVSPGIGDSEIWRTEAAGDKWEKIPDFPNGEPYFMLQHPTDKQVAVVLGRAKTSWITYDKGKTWKSFKTSEHPSQTVPIKFHAADSKRVLFQGMEICDFFTGGCLGRTWYTEDGFESIHELDVERKDCLWAKSTERFTTGDDTVDKNRIVCVVKGQFSPLPKEYRLLTSDNYFKSSIEPQMGGRVVNGMANMAAVKGYIVVAAKAETSRELALYITDDTNTWHRGEFGGHRIEEDAYTVLESTNYSIQIDVKTQDRADIGVLFSSNSNGTYFTQNIEHTNRNEFGIVDFEKIQDIQGIILVNTVQNWKDAEMSWIIPKDVESHISFDDGRTFEFMKVGDRKLHLHSVTEQKQNGKIFSSPAPGLVFGNGNMGKKLGRYDDSDLYASDDAGVTWWKAQDSPHLYEFGGQGSIVVAVVDKGDTDRLAYSYNHGKDWDTVKFPDDHELKVYELTTIPDSTSLKFVLSGLRHTSKGYEFWIYSIDFSGTDKRECKDSDFEDWYARVDSDGKPTCIMGHKQRYRRRKADADCLVKNEFNEALPEPEQCECTDDDFECDYNFRRDREKNECVPAGTLAPPKDACSNEKDEFEGSSGWRLIPGNDCKRKSGAQKDDPIKRPCSDTKAPVASGKISHKEHTFKEQVLQYFYLERLIEEEDDQDVEETIVALTSDGVAHITHDHGKTWSNIEGVEDNVIGLYPHTYDTDTIYLITSSEKVHYSKNRGKSFHYFTAPEGPPPRKEIQLLMFHPDESDWLIWIGGKDCRGITNPNCHTVAHVTQKGGEDWNTLLRYVEKCQFVSRTGSEKRVLCQQHVDEDLEAPLHLVSSDDWFAHKTELFHDVVNFATMSEFVVVAAKTEDKKWLQVNTSVDGSTFAPAMFPPGFQVPHQQAYTVLDSSTHAIFMHVTVNAAPGQEYGTIIKSNSNGTSYVMAIKDVNRDEDGYVDFEKMSGLEGVAIVNVVANIPEVDKGSRKKLKTKMTHNDGADWALIPAPEKDVEGNKYKCASDGIDKCSIHLHGYSERDDPRLTYASPSAIGLVMGVGTVGEFLSNDDTETFMSTDGGVKWKAIRKGNYMWEYGDQGSIVVIVEKGKSTRDLYYTLNEGAEWERYTFSDRDVDLTAITTVPSDNSRNFLLWGANFVINVDFTGLTSDKCRLDEDNPDSEDNDYYLWEPKHPNQDTECLFGHVALYHRKKLDRKCYNGPMIHKLHEIERNCTCTRRDFECDYNFERQSDGSCALIEGLKPADPMQVCRDNKDAWEYYEITGYRRIPISTCEGGMEMDLTSASHPCPGHEKEYADKKKISGVALFFAITLPIAAAAGVGYWVWRNWDGKFGRIRLGDGMGFGTGTGTGSSKWVQWPVAAVSAVIAVLAAVPLLAASLFRSARGAFSGGYGGRTYTSRSSFARGRGDYASVDADEGELLGEDSDEEV